MNTCGCTDTPCGCNRSLCTPVPEVTVIREASPEVNCDIKGWFETLAITSFAPQDFGETQVLTVCDSSKYIPGGCISLRDDAGRQQVQRVLNIASATTITVVAYSNGYSDESTTLNGEIYASPLAVCPLATGAAADCDRNYLRTSEAFIMPATEEDEGGPVQVCFETAGTVSLPLGAQVYIEGAGYLEVAAPPAESFVECAACHYFINLGTAGNAAPGATVPSGGEAFLARAPLAVAPTSGDIAIIQTNSGVGVGAMAGTGTYSNNSVDFVLPWAAKLMLSCVMTADCISATANKTFTYGVEYSTNSGSSWTDMTGDTLHFEQGYLGQAYVVVSKSFAAATYIFRFKVYTVSGSPTYPTIGALDIHILAVRATAIVA